MKNLLIILILVTAFSCRTVKVNEHSKVSVDTAIKNDIKQSSDVHKETSNTSNQSQNTTYTDTTHKVVIETYYSKPDSTGKQAIVKTVKTEIDSGKKLNKQDVNQNHSSQKIDSTGNKIDKSKINNKSKTENSKQTTTKRTTPTWIWLSSAILSVGLVILAYFILKRFYLIK